MVLHLSLQCNISPVAKEDLAISHSYIRVSLLHCPSNFEQVPNLHRLQVRDRIG